MTRLIYWDDTKNPEDKKIYLKRVRKFLEIEDGDTVDDSVLNDLGKGAGIRMRNWLESITENIPEGADIEDDIINAVAFDVCAKYEAIKKNYDGVRVWTNERSDARAGIETGLKRDVDESLIVIPRF